MKLCKLQERIEYLFIYLVCVMGVLIIVTLLDPTNSDVYCIVLVTILGMYFGIFLTDQAYTKAIIEDITDNNMEE